VRDYLSGYFSVGYVDGSVSASARAQTYKLFQETDDIQVLVAHPRTTSHGLTLTAANLTVWYGPTSSTETYLQANQRMNRPGQVRNMTIAQIGATAEEWAVYKSLDTNTDMQETLLALYEKY
jgi:SNF2 family DNA or RNA helicase